MIVIMWSDAVVTLTCLGLRQAVATTLLADVLGLLAIARCEDFRSSVVATPESSWCCRRLARSLLCKHEYSIIHSMTSVIKANTWSPNRHNSTARQPICSVRRAFGALPTNPPIIPVNMVVRGCIQGCIQLDYTYMHNMLYDGRV